MKSLRFIGNGKITHPSFPPRDLTKAEIEAKVRVVGSAKNYSELRKQLIGTGLYEAYKAKKDKS